MLSVDVLVGGPGREAAVSRRSGAAIAEGLRASGHDVRTVDCTGPLQASRLRPGTVVFNIIHGTYGEDGTLQAELEALGRAYVGSDAAASRLCMDKQATKDTLARAGLPVAWGLAFSVTDIHWQQQLAQVPTGGLVLKPRQDGSSVGLHLLRSAHDIPLAVAAVQAELGNIPLLVEERLAGPEYTVGLIDDGQGAWQVLPPIHIAPATATYDYQAKYSRDDTRYLPVEDPALSQRLQSLALQAAEACACRDLCRVDVMAHGDRLCILEINTLPGFTDHSLLPKAAARVGLGFPALVDRLARCAYKRGGCALGVVS